MIKLPTISFVGYVTGMGIHGFYRGYYNLYNTPDFNKPEPLIVDRILSGIF
jgi:hypothetical protein